MSAASFAKTGYRMIAESWQRGRNQPPALDTKANYVERAAPGIELRLVWIRKPSYRGDVKGRRKSHHLIPGFVGCTNPSNEPTVKEIR